MVIDPRQLVTAALIEDSERRVLVGKRPTRSKHGGLWEFPGGKVNEGEAPPDCLRRELREELQVRVEVGEPYARIRSDLAIELLVFRASLVSGTPRALDHDEIQWVTVEKLSQLSMPPADVPVVEFLQRELSQKNESNDHEGDFRPSRELRAEMEAWASMWGVGGLPCRTRFEWSDRLRASLARALPERFLIRFNPVLQSRSLASTLREAVCHEFAHLAVFLLHGRAARPHGPEWQSLVESGGFRARTGIRMSELGMQGLNERNG